MRCGSLLVSIAWPFSCICLTAANAATPSMFICYAYFGYVSDLGFTYQQNLGRAWVDAELGTVSQYEEGVGFMARADQEVIMDKFIADGCQVIVTGSDVMAGLTFDYAELHPNIRFLCLTCTGAETPTNLAAVDIRIQQPGYIGGFVAASQEGVSRIGYVASNYVSASFRNANSFALGALSANPNVKLTLIHTGSWFTPRNELIAAKRLIEQHDVDLLAYDSDSTVVVAVAHDTDIKSIAIKVDGTAAYGESNLMSRVFQWNTPLQEAVSAAFDIRNWSLHRRDNEYVGFEKEAVSLGTFSSSVTLSARIGALQLQERYVTEGDFTFCPGPSGLNAFCPVNASAPSAELGGIPPTLIFPCAVPGGTVYPEDADCLSDTQVRAMSWLVSEYKDLGLLDVPDVCPPGTKLDFSGSTLCIPCEEGHVSLQEDLEACEPCSAGRYAVGGIECRRCDVGSFSNTSGNSGCTNCPAGTAAGVQGLTECLSCEPGYLAPAAGQTACNRCPIGSWSDGSLGDSCHACPEGETTQFRAAVFAEECICRAGSYREEDGACKNCPKGMVCELGSDIRNVPTDPARGGPTTCFSSSCEFPRTLPKHMTLPGAPLKVYKCLEEDVCPGGTANAVSSCASHRQLDEVACGLCEEDAFLNQDDECEPCSGGSEVALLISVLIVGPLVIGILSITVNRDLLLQRNGTVSIVILGGVFVTALQTAVVFNQVSLEWVEPISSAMKVVSLVGFDLSYLRTECYFDVTPSSRFLGRQLVAPACMPVLILVILVKKWRFKPEAMVQAEVGNAAGTVFSIFYISVVTSAVTPFVCYPHPSDSGAGLSMVSEPAVLCWEGEDRHVSMVITAIFSFLLVPLLFLVICLHAVHRYPQMMSRNDDGQKQWLHKYRFLFFRFKPRSYSYAVALLLRNLFICLIPAVTPGDNVGLQVLLLCGMLLLFLGFQSSLQPWRTKVANVVDSLTSGVLILVLLCGIIRTDVSVSDAEVTALGTLVLGIGLLGIAVGAAIGIRDTCWPRVRYDYFLSHHKAAAAGQARFLQTIIIRKLHKTCFLDSDDLQNLNTLFDIVKTAVVHFVVYLTKDMLARPWCAGEIVVAKEAKLSFTKIQHPRFVTPLRKQLQDIDEFLAKGTNLLDYNIEKARVSEALIWVCFGELTTIQVNPAISGLEVFYTLLTDLTKSKKKSAHFSLPTQLDNMVVSSDPEDLEAVAAGGILITRIQEQAAAALQGSVVFMPDLGHTIGESELLRCIASARVVVVILAQYTLRCPQQLQTMMAATAGGISAIALRTPAFNFPDDKYYDQQLANVLTPVTVMAQQAIRAFFERIALPLSTHASESTLQTECDQVWSRVPSERITKLHQTVLHVQIPSPCRRSGEGPMSRLSTGEAYVEQISGDASPGSQSGTKSDVIWSTEV